MFEVLFPKVISSVYYCRELVVDLLGNPGTVHSPDSSINGHLLSSVPSPFQAAHLLGCQNSYTTDTSWTQMMVQGQTGALVAKSQYPGKFYFNLMLILFFKAAIFVGNILCNLVKPLQG